MEIDEDNVIVFGDGESMAILTIPHLEQLAWTRGITKTAQNKVAAAMLQEGRAPLLTQYDIFLCHRSLDLKHVTVLRDVLCELGYVVYIDWAEDTDLSPANVSPSTADRLRTRIENSSALLVVDSDNLPTSQWVPWECGYADGLGKHVGILPIKQEDVETYAYHGQEYFGLYPYIDYHLDRSSVWRLWANRSQSRYINFDDWLQRDDLRSRRGSFPEW
ncbi:TIR domain-containing protein [Sorangium sp. So ce341]|uniref:TIR domain-containing protein n=1 Tax=Sorangium sp. So ce341 TaxID=3133302 RepID=UPI003F5DE58E